MAAMAILKVAIYLGCFGFVRILFAKSCSSNNAVGICTKPDAHYEGDIFMSVPISIVKSLLLFAAFKVATWLKFNLFIAVSSLVIVLMKAQVNWMT